ncbi:unnamed protein product [Ceratitis capitata]|uniref:(Mediterranean fruit fly) hypothetical protein n=1 Tax=Ceratitis capitata TaxID=7213 RepID=A0A811V3R0_CERCA|nr:unnamed protein product [Ceratitis capitata]
MQFPVSDNSKRHNKSKSVLLVISYHAAEEVSAVNAMLVVLAFPFHCFHSQPAQYKLYVSPGHMTPWLTINMFALSFELILWLVEVLVGATKLDLHTLFTFSLPLANYLFVRCVHNVFQNAIETNDVDDLRLWKRGFK